MAKQMVSIVFDEKEDKDEANEAKEKATYDVIEALSNEVYKSTFESVKKISSKLKETK